MAAGKVVFVVFDGLGDRPVAGLGGKTPLEAASTPNLDKLAREGVTGLLHTVDVGVRPGSDAAHLNLFGYNTRNVSVDEFGENVYPGRGPIEAAGIGLTPKPGEVALRANFATVKNGKIADRRAGRIDSVRVFCEALNGLQLDGVTFAVKAGTGHRAAVVLRGRGLSAAVSDGDPHAPGEGVREVKALDESREARFTADVLNKFVAKAHDVLSQHPENRKREAAGKLPANHVLLRGAGMCPAMPSFEEKWGLKAACVASGGLYKGVGHLLGMDVVDVVGATGNPDTDVKAKFAASVKALESHDFVFVHLKGTDVCAEDGNPRGKKEFIEKADKEFPLLMKSGALVVVTGDHSTPCALKAHSADPVPLLMHGEGIRTDNVQSFGERACVNGGLGRLIGLQLMPEIINVLGKSELHGA